MYYRFFSYHEAKSFIDNLTSYLDFKPTDQLLDLACGKGRHSIYLNQKGYNVTGIDLSPQAIQLANRFANDRLLFLVHDMRKPIFQNSFDYILNLFTSFGYFEKEEENIQVLQSVHQALKKNGKLVLDFFNPTKVTTHLVKKEEKIIDNIQFNITKEIKDNFLLKSIQVIDNDKKYEFIERVQLIQQSDFERYFKQSSLKILNVLGNYNLDSYDSNESERMIFITCKI